MSTCEVCPPERKCPGPTCAPDDPHWDGTEGAHPAWWRGNDRGFADACREVMKVLADPKKVLHECGVTAEPWASTRVAVARAAISDAACRMSKDAAIATFRAVYDLLGERTEQRDEAILNRREQARIHDETLRQERAASDAEILRLRSELAEARRALAVFAARAHRET